MMIKTSATRAEIKRVLLLLCDVSHRYTQLVICHKTGGVRYDDKVIDILWEIVHEEKIKWK